MKQLRHNWTIRNCWRCKQSKPVKGGTGKRLADGCWLDWICADCRKRPA